MNLTKKKLNKSSQFHMRIIYLLKYKIEDVTNMQLGALELYATNPTHNNYKKYR